MGIFLDSLPMSGIVRIRDMMYTVKDPFRPDQGDVGFDAPESFKGGMRNAVQSLSITASPQILFVDMTESSDPLNEINGLAEVCEPGTIVWCSTRTQRLAPFWRKRALGPPDRWQNW